MSAFDLENQEFSPEDIEEYERISREGIEVLLANTKSLSHNSDGNIWKIEFKREDLNLTVYSSDVKGSSLKRFKAVCSIPCEPRVIQDFISDDSHRLTWDKSLCELNRLPVSVDDAVQKKTYILRCATKRVGPISGRDFIDACGTYFLEDGSIVNAGAGIPLDRSKFSESSGFVRGFNNPGSGWHFEPDPEFSGGTRISYVIHCDLKGWFMPVIVNNAIGGSYITFFEDLRAALKAKEVI